jgi:hypothetical protein
MSKIVNGTGDHDEEEALDDIRRIQHDIAEVVRQRQPLQIPPPLGGRTPNEPPFAQVGHDLLLESVDAIAASWVDQLKTVRQNSERLEQLVLERIGKVKNDITQLYVLGSAVVSEAKRGNEINNKLVSEIDKLAEEPA